jgi:uncharacterized protein
MIYMEDRHYRLLMSILKKYPYTFYAFGSRVKGTQKRFSDIDIIYKDVVPERVITNIKSDLEESNLPFTVDLINWQICDANFKRAVEQDLVPLA